MKSVSFSHEPWAFPTPTSYLTLDHRPQVRGNYVTSVVTQLITSLDVLMYVCVSPFYVWKQGSTPRPRNTQLYLRETEDLDVEGGLGTCGFEEWWVEYLRDN
jgi:hypothetical protein